MKLKFCKTTICPKYQQLQSWELNPGLLTQKSTPSSFTSVFLNCWHVRKIIFWLWVAQGGQRPSEMAAHRRPVPSAEDWLGWETSGWLRFGNMRASCLKHSVTWKHEVWGCCASTPPEKWCKPQKQRIGVQPGIGFWGFRGPSSEWVACWAATTLVGVLCVRGSNAKRCCVCSGSVWPPCSCSVSVIPVF